MQIHPSPVISVVHMVFEGCEHLIVKGKWMASQLSITDDV